MDGAETARRMAAVERRLRAAEDHLAILDLIGAYGPAVDSCSGRATAALWSQSGSYDYGAAPLEGADAVGRLVELDSHRSYVTRGCAHVMGVPRIVLDGDRATATGYSCVHVHDGDHWRVERASANRWELVRTPDGWKVARRINRPLDGSPAGPDLLRDGVRDLQQQEQR